MPRETIVGTDSDDFKIQVGWSKEHEHLQVGVTTPDYSGPDGDPTKSLWSNLDRNGVNHLIRTLRKARDSAFGRDE